jgi:hypothetical protein
MVRADKEILSERLEKENPQMLDALKAFKQVFGPAKWVEYSDH